MKGGILNLAMREPLIRPQTAPTASAATMGTITGTSSPGYLADAQSVRWARLEATTAARAKTEPEDRSMPPVMITIVTPMAIRPITEIWRTTLTRFLGCRNAGERKDMAINMAKRMSTMPYFLRKAFSRSRFSVSGFGLSSSGGLHDWVSSSTFAHRVCPCSRPTTALPVAARMMLSCVASLRSNSPPTLPSCMTSTRSLMPRISGSSEEIMMMALPSWASLHISR